MRWVDYVKEFNADSGYPLEVPWAGRPLQPCGDFFYRNPSGETGGVHIGGIRGENDIHPLACQQVNVVPEVARVASEILARAELGGVDEDAYYNRSIFGSRSAYKGQMAFV